LRQPVRTTARPRTPTSRIEVSDRPLTDSEITISRSRTLAIAALIRGAIPAISATASMNSTQPCTRTATIASRDASLMTGT